MANGAFQPWFEVEVEDGIAFVRRTAEPYASPDDVHTAFEALLGYLRRRPLRGQITDLRDAVGRNDPEFEAAIAQHRKDVYGAAPHNAVVIRSAIGRLQIERHAAADGVRVGVFQDLEAAEAYLRSRA